MQALGCLSRTPVRLGPAQRSGCSRRPAAAWGSPRLLARPQLAAAPRSLVRRPLSLVQARSQQQSSEGASALQRSGSGDMEGSLYLEPFLRTFVLGAACGALLEGGHVALQVLTGSFPGVSEFSPILAADHVIGFASWIALYCVEAWGILSVLRRFNFDHQAAAKDLRALTTLPQRMLPLKMNIFKRLVLAGAKRRPAAAAAAADSAAAPSAADLLRPALPVDGVPLAPPQALEASTAPQAPAPPSAPTARPAPKAARNSIAPAPGLLGRRAGSSSIPTEAPPKQGGGGPGPGPAPPSPPGAPQLPPAAAKRQRELQDRESYLSNFWYAAALSEKVKDKPVKVELCGRELVLFRGDDGRMRCVDNACPHRGAPLSDGWVGKQEGHDCIVCPYHGWAFDEEGSLRDVPAAATKGEWPRRQLLDAYAVEEKGGFVWVFYGSKALPADARPPIPYVPELDDPSWKPVYEEMEFECNHFGVFENAIDMAHIHYLHSDSFGNQGKPEIRDMQTTADEWGVTATFTIHNKPVNAFWALFQVPAVHVTARAMLPSTSVVTFTLGNGLSFTTFVNTVPISATRSVNRFALVRKLAWDKSGLFNARAWDGMARNAMIKILSEDKAMVEQLKYSQLPAEYSVRADLPQVEFRKLRQRYVDLGYAVPPETALPPHAAGVSRRGPAGKRAAQQGQQQQCSSSSEGAGCGSGQ